MRQPERNHVADMPVIPKRGRGRPKKENALSGAERARRCREKKRLLGGVTQNTTTIQNVRERDFAQEQRDLANLHYFVAELINAYQARKRLDPAWLASIMLEHARIASRYDYV